MSYFRKNTVSWFGCQKSSQIRLEIKCISDGGVITLETCWAIMKTNSPFRGPLGYVSYKLYRKHLTLDNTVFLSWNMPIIFCGHSEDYKRRRLGLTTAPEGTDYVGNNIFQLSLLRYLQGKFIKHVANVYFFNIRLMLHSMVYELL